MLGLLLPDPETSISFETVDQDHIFHHCASCDGKLLPVAGPGEFKDLLRLEVR